LPIHVHQDLGLSTFVVGLVTGSQFASSLISRVWSGRYADSRGGKRAVVLGLLTAVVGGLLYLVSVSFIGTPWLSVSVLLVGRALLGGAESLVITGAVSWGLGLAGPANTGRVIAWVGMAMFASLAFGAPVGTTLYALGGFTQMVTRASLGVSCRVRSYQWAATMTVKQSLGDLSPDEPYDVIVLGGGYAGLMATLRMARRTLRLRIALVSTRDCFIERVRLQEAIATEVPLRIPSIAAFVRNTPAKFIRGTVLSLDADRRCVRIATNDQQRELAFHQAVYARLRY